MPPKEKKAGDREKSKDKKGEKKEEKKGADAG
jgi:hypothetical protein